ncbi:MAG: hypothetical protein CVU06_01995, partial [Bacteroidetes bacterium HGW-Bacteroidetes-22]
MKKLTLTIIILVLTLSINAQSDSCNVLLEKISGRYTGKCLDGLANGKGKSIGEDTYIGTFKDGLPNGKGKYLYKNGDTFQGYWLNGQKDGKGKFEYTINGEKYTLIGYWKKDEYFGVLTEMLSKRQAQLTDMRNDGQGNVHLEFRVPTKGLIGFRSAFLTATRGESIMNTTFLGYEAWQGDIASTRNGALVA